MRISTCSAVSVPPPHEPATQLLEIRGHDEDVRKRGKDEGVAAGADVPRSVRVDIQQDVDAVAEILQHGTLERAVAVTMDLGVLEELSGHQPALELVA